MAKVWISSDSDKVVGPKTDSGTVRCPHCRSEYLRAEFRCLNCGENFSN